MARKPRIDRSERGWRRTGTAPLGFGVLLATLTSIPYLVLYFSSPASHAVYNWILPPYPEDGLAYLAWVKQAASGAFLFKVLYTPDPQHALIFQPFFLIAGWIAALTRLSGGVVLFWLRLAGILLFVFLLIRFLKELRLAPRLAWGACALVCLTTGAGGFFAAGDFRPADLWVVDLNPFWGLTWNPLFPWALGLLLGIAILTVRALGAEDMRRRRNLLIQCGGLVGLLVMLHPYDAVNALVIMVSFAWPQFRRIRAIDVVSVAVLAVPPALYQILLSVFNPVLAMHSQARMDSPSLWAYLVGVAPVLLLGALGAIAAWQDGRFREFVPLMSWVVLAFALAYAPIWFQRKMVFGVYIPLGVLAALGANEISRWFSERNRGAYWILIGGLITFSLRTHFANAERGRADVQNDPIAYYQADAMLDAARALEKTSHQDGAVLSSYPVMRLIPGLSGNAVLMGHWAQSVRSEEFTPMLNLLLRENARGADDDAKDRLLELPIEYVLVDPELKQQFGGKIPGWLLAVGDKMYESEPDYVLLRIRRH